MVVRRVKQDIIPVPMARRLVEDTERGGSLGMFDASRQRSSEWDGASKLGTMKVTTEDLGCVELLEKESLSEG